MTDRPEPARYLVEWLSKEDDSAFGECKGRDLDVLIDQGLARVVTRDQRGRGFDRVALTAAGLALAKAPQ
jgi:hypothetical protein